ncbi:hypothetical protein [Nocardia sp. NPDC002869]|uniref:hypothetical protein n=1 Tax=Nocardia sp. NPDC002869 TaxID=3161032 RepID=UPI00398CDE7A
MISITTPHGQRTAWSPVSGGGPVTDADRDPGRWRPDRPAPVAASAAWLPWGV